MAADTAGQWYALIDLLWPTPQAWDLSERRIGELENVAKGEADRHAAKLEEVQDAAERRIVEMGAEKADAVQRVQAQWQQQWDTAVGEAKVEAERVALIEKANAEAARRIGEMEAAKADAARRATKTKAAMAGDAAKRAAKYVTMSLALEQAQLQATSNQKNGAEKGNRIDQSINISYNQLINMNKNSWVVIFALIVLSSFVIVGIFSTWRTYKVSSKKKKERSFLNVRKSVCYECEDRYIICIFLVLVHSINL